MCKITYQKVIAKLYELWKRLDGYKLLIGLSMGFVADHMLIEHGWIQELVYLVSYFFVIVGTADKARKSDYGQKVMDRVGTLRGNNR